MTPMQLISTLIVLCLGANAVPTNNSLRTSCNVNSYNAVSSISNCDIVNVGSFTVPAKTTITFNLKQGATLNFNGEIIWTYSGYWDGYLLEIIGNSVTVNGASSHLLHGHGEKYWDGKGGAGKPVFLYLKGTGSNFYKLKLKNCPERCVTIDNAHTVVVDGFNIDNSEGASLGHNTDGFDIAHSTYITIENSIVKGQDDCVAINSGNFILINNLQCTGTHGFDIAAGQGSSYDNNLVHDITFANSILNGGMYGLHILTCNDGGTGKIYNIVYENIKIYGPSDYGVMIQQDFSNAKQGSTGIPKGNVPISNVTLTGIKGYMNGQYSSAVTIRCAACATFKFDVQITGAKAKNECTGMNPSGFTC